jgi:hypothetical protein
MDEKGEDGSHLGVLIFLKFCPEISRFFFPHGITPLETKILPIKHNFPVLNL